jgi:hypothetical protein
MKPMGIESPFHDWITLCVAGFITAMGIAIAVNGMWLEWGESRQQQERWQRYKAEVKMIVTPAEVQMIRLLRNHEHITLTVNQARALWHICIEDDDSNRVGDGHGPTLEKAWAGMKWVHQLPSPIHA